MTTISRAAISALAALGDATAAEVSEIVPTILGYETPQSKVRLIAAWLVMTRHIPAHVALVHLDRWLTDPTSLGGTVVARAMTMADERGLPAQVADALTLEDAPEMRSDAQEWAALVSELGDDELRVLLAIDQDMRDVCGADPSAISRADLVTVLGVPRPPARLSWLLFVARRLRMGQDQYGRLDLATDGRDWEREAREERADEAVYRACAAVQAGMRGPL